MASVDIGTSVIVKTTGISLAKVKGIRVSKAQCKLVALLPVGRHG